MLDFRVNTFLTVCKYMNYTQAAHELNLTQPAVTQHIQYFETRYGQKLFTYEKKKLSLTKAGEIFFRLATTIKNDELFMIQEMSPSLDHITSYHIGATLTVGEYILLKPLATYLKQYPSINIELTIANTNELLAKLQEHKISFAIIEGSYARDYYGCLPFSTEKYVAVCSTTYVPHNKNIQKLKDLCHERLLLREEGSGTREIMVHNLAAHGISIEDFDHKLEINSLHAIIGLLKEGCGISFLYEAAIRDDLKAGTLKIIPLEDFSVEHDLTFLWNKGSNYEHLFCTFCKKLKASYKNS